MGPAAVLPLIGKLLGWGGAAALGASGISSAVSTFTGTFGERQAADFARKERANQALLTAAMLSDAQRERSSARREAREARYWDRESRREELGSAERMAAMELLMSRWNRSDQAAASMASDLTNRSRSFLADADVSAVDAARLLAASPGPRGF